MDYDRIPLVQENGSSKGKIMRVSVAMATYNGVRFLAEQLDSIEAQTLRPFELVVSDDCSTDGTWEAVLAFAATRPWVRAYRNERNLGFAKNFERAISLAAGDFIALSDQDDVWEARKLASLVKAIGDGLIVHSDARIVDENGDEIYSSLSKYNQKRTTPGIYDLLYQNYLTGCTIMFRRELATMALPVPTDAYHDWWLAIVATSTTDIRYFPEPLVRYRQHNSNVIGYRYRPRTDFFSLVRSIIRIKNRRRKMISSIAWNVDLITDRKLAIHDKRYVLFAASIQRMMGLQADRAISIRYFFAYTKCLSIFRSIEKHCIIYWALSAISSFFP